MLVLYHVFLLILRLLSVIVHNSIQIWPVIIQSSAGNPSLFVVNFSLNMIYLDCSGPNLMMLEGQSPDVRDDEVSRAMRRRSANVNLQKCMSFTMNLSHCVCAIIHFSSPAVG
jgi:hypothetical protein